MTIQKIFMPKSKNSVPDVAMILRDTSLQIGEACARIEALDGLKKRIGIIRLWPDQAVAEHENVERIRSAAKLIGVDVIELDRNGYILGLPETMVSREDVDFVIHLHFETPKAYDVPSVAAMWNPMNFYFDWGFDIYWANQMSHDIFAWTGSEEIKKMITQERGERVAGAMPLFNHTLAEPIFEPQRRSDFEIFYCGINWEKISGKKGRHDEVLSALDKAGKLAIYGPEVVQGVKVWDGYDCYRGSLPFDGRTVIEKIAGAGACLVFSSDAHKQSGIMSNRLFEGLAAGAVIIGDEHPFIPQAIGDSFIKVPSQLDSKERVEIILNAIKGFKKDPESAYKMASVAQNSFVEKYFLCSQIANLFEAYKNFSNKQKAITVSATQPVVDVVVQACSLSGKAIVTKLQELSAGFGHFANFIIICDKKAHEWMQIHCGHMAAVVPCLEDKYEILTPSDIVRYVKPYLKTQKMWLSTLIESVFYTQFICAAVAFKHRSVGRLGHLLSHTDDRGNIHYDYRAGDIPLERFHDAARSSFIFDSQWLIENISLSRISWRECVRIAELQENGIAIDQPSTITISLKAYEKNLSLGYQEKPISSNAEYASRVGVLRHFSSDSCFIKSYVTLPDDYSFFKSDISISPETKSVFAKILGAGWHNIEPDLVWSSTKKSDLWLKLVPTASKIRFYVAGNPYIPSHAQTIQVLFNMTPVQSVLLQNGEDIVIELNIADTAWRLNELNRVSFEVSEICKLPENINDGRTLGICLKRVEVE